MKYLLNIVVIVNTILTRTVIQSHDVKIYEQYLLKFEKPISRLSNPVRIATFFDNLLSLHEDETHENAAHKSFTTEVNEMSDWSDDEIKSRFVTNLFFSEMQEEPFNVKAIRILGPDAVHSQSQHQLEFQSEYNPSQVSSLISLTAPDYDFSNMNWASSSNPKGISVLSSVRNQGMCGACWAFVATASVEAQVRIAGGKQIPLSVQELIDCDTALNRGCNGGNPVYAFEYTMANALTSWDDYPYKEMASICHRSKFRARSSVEGYRRLTSSNQAELLQFVKMAPVAVGICGTDKSFMFYSRGIYNSANCCVTQNHAVLLVGYGHDPVTDLDYWIAQNSWGLMWGERGFIRLLRTNDSISLGQCGLAMNPVAAVGGYVLSSQDLDDPIQHTDDTNNDNRDSAGNGIGKDRKDSEKRWPVHRLPFGGALIQWLNNNRQVLCLSVAGCLMSFSLVLLAFATYVEYRDNKIEKERNSGIQNSSNCSHEDNDSYDENSQGALFRNSIGRQSGLDSSDRRDCHGTSFHHLQRHEDCGLLSGFHGGRKNVSSNFISGARRLLGYPAAEPAPASFGIPVHYAVTELTTLASRTSDCSVQYRECSIQPSAGVISYPHKNNHIDYGAVGL